VNPTRFWRIAPAAALSFSLFAPPHVLAFSPQSARAAKDAQPFVGTWTASHQDTPIIVLELHLEKGKLLGGIRVCAFTINTEDTGKIVEITDRTLSGSVTVHNLEIFGKSLSFDWKDPDGDENHWKLELTGANAGRLIWLGLPKDLKAEPIPVTRPAPTQP